MAGLFTSSACSAPGHVITKYGHVQVSVKTVSGKRFVIIRTEIVKSRSCQQGGAGGYMCI